MIEINVGQNNLEKAMRVLKRKLIREGVFKELKSRRFYEKPSERRKRKKKEAFKKRRKDQDRSRRSSF
jgi:small subunit ribosomal protein S21